MGGESAIAVALSFIEELRSRLALPLPGVTAQARMAPQPRTVPPLMKTEEEAVPSAVLILLFRKDGNWSFFLTERSHSVEYHPGQLSLPGGAQEDDEPLETTALRETEEEIGVSPGVVTLLGELTTLFIPVSGFRVHPFVGWSNGELETAIDETEAVSYTHLRAHETKVAALHAIEMSALLNDSLVGRELRTIRGVDVDVPFFHFGELKVWGATAAILSECKDVFADCFELEKML